MSSFSKSSITTEEDLRNMLGYPSELVNSKVIHHIDHHCKNFISKTPLIFISTANKDGFCDVSPRGDAPGFVEVFNERFLVIPERPGNKRCDSLLNIISNSQIGIIFIIPGLKETLRVNGKALITNDQELLEKHQVDGKSPKVAIVVEVEECYIHCAKAFMRSMVWQSETWISKEELPQIPTVIAAHVNKDSFTAEKIADALKESYTERLY